MRNPCSGESQVCRTIKEVIVHWTSERIEPVVFWNDGTNKVQTYCGLEIVIITMKPNNSCIQRALAASVSLLGTTAPNVSLRAMFTRPTDAWPLTKQYLCRRMLAGIDLAPGFCLRRSMIAQVICKLPRFYACLSTRKFVIPGGSTDV